MIFQKSQHPVPPTLARNCRKFWYIYRHLCSNKRILKLTYWDVMPEKLMVEISINNSMENWDKLNLTWNKQKVLGWLLPNN